MKKITGRIRLFKILSKVIGFLISAATVIAAVNEELDKRGLELKDLF